MKLLKHRGSDMNKLEQAQYNYKIAPHGCKTARLVALRKTMNKTLVGELKADSMITTIRNFLRGM